MKKSISGKIHGIVLYFCSNETVDLFYQYLKTKPVHFAILKLRENAPLSSLCNRVPPIYIDDVHRLETLLKDPVADDNNEHLRFGQNREYTYAFLVRNVQFLTQKVVIASELYLNQLIPHDYQYRYSYHTADNEFRKFPIYETASSNRAKKEILVIENSNGYGDSIITMPLLKMFADHKKREGCQVVFEHYYKQSYELSQVFLKAYPNRLCKYKDDRTKLSALFYDTYNYDEVYNFDNTITHSAFTKLQEAAQFLGIDSYASMLTDLTIDYLNIPSKQSKLLLSAKRKHRYMIGIQFYTEHDKTCSYKRSWSNDHIHEFVELCNLHDVFVANLVPENDIKAKNVINVGAVSVPQLFTVVSQLDAVVGIDSCCGHIAGVLRKPNITLWGKVLQDKSQETLSMNYSLTNTRYDVNAFDPQLVFKRLLDILEGKLQLNGDIKSIYNIVDQAEMIDIEN